MSTGQTNNAKNAANGLTQKVDNTMAPVISGLQSDYNSAKATQQATGQQATAGYTQQQTTGGYNPDVLPGLRSQNSTLATTGGYNQDNLNGVRSNMATQSKTGGFDPTQLSNLQGSAANFATSGAYDPGSYDKLKSTYGGFMDNGGYDATQKSNFLDQATSGIKDTYGSLSLQERLAQNKTGSSGGGGDLSQMARQLAQAQGSQTLAAQTSLDKAINDNKMAGAAGLNTVESGNAATKIAGLNSGIGLAENQAGNIINATKNAGDLETNVASGIRSGQATQNQFEGDVAKGVQNANNGLANLYNTQTGQVTDQGKQLLAALGLQFQTDAQAAQILAQISSNPGTFNTIMSGIGSVIGK
jgi:hypothetical protein